jgi:hypothetical protein
MTVTTAQCKKFLTDFLRLNPEILKSLFGDDVLEQEVDNTGKDYLTVVTNPGSWKREWKRKADPKTDPDFCWPDSTKQSMGYYKPGVRPNRFAEPTGTWPISDIAWVRWFTTKDESLMDGGFFVLELENGQLLLGQHVDEWY